MHTTLAEHGLAQSTRIAFGQFQQCGFIYSFRKFLTITLLHKLSAHLAVAHALALPHTRELAKHHPKSAFKYLHKYLARSFDIHSRSAILSNHYRYLDGRVRSDFISRICRGKILLWEDEADGHRYRIGLTYPKNEEGELFLVFSEDDTAIFTLAFTIAPGKMLGQANEQIAFIGRLQGTANNWESIKRATKSFQDISPSALLLDAVRAIATSLDIHGIVGVSASNQVCLSETRRDTATSTYDEFWMSAGAFPINGLGFYLPTFAEDKPLSSIKNNHRSRVKRKREFRSELVKQISQTFERQCIAPRQRPAPYLVTGMRESNYCGTLPAMNALS